MWCGCMFACKCSTYSIYVINIRICIYWWNKIRKCGSWACMRCDIMSWWKGVYEFMTLIVCWVFNATVWKVKWIIHTLHTLTLASVTYSISSILHQRWTIYIAWLWLLFTILFLSLFFFSFSPIFIFLFNLTTNSW